jgi:SAM-dependent methyltransferase
VLATIAPVTAPRVAATLARRLYYRLPPPARTLLRPKRRPPITLGEPFAHFERESGPALELLDRYRTSLKPRWRITWPETRILLALHADGLLPPELVERADELLAARTLPFAPADLRDDLARLAGALPERVRGLQLVPSAAEVGGLVTGYRATAAALLARVGGSPRRALEIGAGSGYLSLALTERGLDAVPSDLEPEGYVDDAEWDAVAHAFGAGGVRVIEADAGRLPFADGEFDLVVSSSALEHMHDPAAVLRECFRVLRPGGTSYHVVDAWFGPGGGHSLCGTDLPWGHVRLTDAEFAGYVRLHRPLEAVDAIASRDSDFQQPRLTSAELAAAARSAGFRVVSLDLPRRSDHLALLTPEVEADCRRVHRSVTRDDLLAASVVLLLRRAA